MRSGSGCLAPCTCGPSRSAAPGQAPAPAAWPPRLVRAHRETAPRLGAPPRDRAARARPTSVIGVERADLAARAAAPDACRKRSPCPASTSASVRLSGMASQAARKEARGAGNSRRSRFSTSAERAACGRPPARGSTRPSTSPAEAEVRPRIGEAGTPIVGLLRHHPIEADDTAVEMLKAGLPQAEPVALAAMALERRCRGPESRMCCRSGPPRSLPPVARPRRPTRKPLGSAT